MAVYKKFSVRGLQPAGKISNQLTKHLVSKKESFLASILYDWPLIVGEKYADTLKPERISFPKDKNLGATLHLSVNNGSIALMAHHLQPLILGKVNQFVGYAAFEKISLHHTEPSLTRMKADSKKLASLAPRGLEERDLEELEQLLSQTPDGTLKEALKNLGESLYLQKAPLK